MGVVGVDSVVVEGWSSCFVVGLVLVVGQGLYFGELVLAPFGLSGDFYGVVGQFCFLDTATTPAFVVGVLRVLRGVCVLVVSAGS
ncbi:Uncharacterised protein [Corynebacterium minutissimum]|uniref:Uncharacterized protein n=1 Tax=Corynebacterium minutissimum TaxID=38301 RepID=A0A376CX89_9CORY|nr:Uncharacterised protein [Corynebacterium minutissimum]